MHITYMRIFYSKCNNELRKIKWNKIGRGKGYLTEYRRNMERNERKREERENESERAGIDNSGRCWIAGKTLLLSCSVSSSISAQLNYSERKELLIINDYNNDISICNDTILKHHHLLYHLFVCFYLTAFVFHY